jgi:hypothetical protein
MMISPAENGGATVVASRFLGAYAETELRSADGAVQIFAHRPVGPLGRGTRVSVTHSSSAPQ